MSKQTREVLKQVFMSVVSGLITAIVAVILWYSQVNATIAVFNEKFRMLEKSIDKLAEKIDNSGLEGAKVKLDLLHNRVVILEKKD
jgi:hypothetical protein